MKRQNPVFAKQLPMALRSAVAVALPLVFIASTVRVAVALDDTSLTNIAPLPVASELFAGQDKTGPYPLRWKKLPAATGQYKPTVIVDDKQLPDGAYTWDANNGTITFATALKTTSMAHIEYPYDPKSSERNANTGTTQVTIPMIKTGGTSLQLTALPGDINNTKSTGIGADNDTLLVWKVASSPMSLAGGGLTTQAYLAPDGRTNGGGEDGLWDRSGLALGYKLGNDKSGVDAAFTRYGREFAPTVGKALQLGDTAQQVRSLAARYTVASWMKAEWKQSDTDQLAQNGGRNDLQQMIVRLGGTTNLPSLNLTRTEEGNTNSSGETTKTTDRLEMSAKLGKQVGVNGTAQQVQSENPDKTGEKSTDVAVNLQAQSTDKSQAATLAVTNSTKDSSGNGQDQTGIALTLKASPSVTITAEQKKQAVLTGDKIAANAQQSAQAQIALAPGATLSGGVGIKSVVDTTANIQNKVQATSVAAKIGAGKAIEIQQTVVTRDGDTPGTATYDTTDTRLALRPMPGLTLSGAMTNHPEQDGSVLEIRREEMNIAAKVGALQLGSGYTITETPSLNGLQTGQFSLSVGLRVNQYTSLTGGYTDGLLYGITDSTATTARGSQVYTLGLTHNLGNMLNFTFGGSVSRDKNPGVTNPNNYKAEAKLGVQF